jgi:nucleoid-associated protein YgaU
MNDNGNRVRQAVTLTLQHFVEDVYLARRSAANRRRAKKAANKKPGAATKRVPVKKAKPRVTRRRGVVAFGDGEDLLSIAARELGDADRWLEIAEANGIRDPRSLSEGQVIRLP